MSEVLLETKNLSKYFDLGSGFLGRNKKILKAVDQVSFPLTKARLSVWLVSPDAEKPQ